MFLTDAQPSSGCSTGCPVEQPDVRLINGMPINAGYAHAFCLTGRPVEHPDNQLFNRLLVVNSRHSRDSHGPIQYVKWSWVSKQTINVVSQLACAHDYPFFAGLHP